VLRELLAQVVVTQVQCMARMGTLEPVAWARMRSAAHAEWVVEVAQALAPCPT